MSTQSDALEGAVRDYLGARTACERTAGPRARAQADHAFARLAALLAPRIRYFTRRYGLCDVASDAEQVCAIALHRAAGRYDPRRARFTTYVNWQIRAELQALRQRLRGDGGRGATLSLDMLVEAGADASLADDRASEAAEARAACHSARRCADRLVADWAARRRAVLARQARIAPVRIEARVKQEAALVRRHLVDVDPERPRLSESERHIVRRAVADIARRALAPAR